VGVEGHLVQVEAHAASGLPAFILVGLPDASLSEARERVRAAVTSCGLPWDARRRTVNLSPASLPKAGSAFDLAIAVACLGADSLPDAEHVKRSTRSDPRPRGGRDQTKASRTKQERIIAAVSGFQRACSQGDKGEIEPHHHDRDANATGHTANVWSLQNRDQTITHTETHSKSPIRARGVTERQEQTL